VVQLELGLVDIGILEVEHCCKACRDLLEGTLDPAADTLDIREPRLGWGNLDSRNCSS